MVGYNTSPEGAEQKVNSITVAIIQQKKNNLFRGFTSYYFLW